MAEQRSLFGGAMAAPVVAGPDPDGLRPYQREAVESIKRELAEKRSTLLVAATGLGKTQMFGALAKHWPGRVLVLAHRDELISQAAARLQQMAGEIPDVEQADRHAAGARLVVGSVATLKRKRLQRFAPDAFSLVIIDEAHHAAAKGYRAIVDHFSGAKILGVTATPDRLDEAALGEIFETVAYRVEIDQGISGGWLCQMRVQRVVVEGVDFSQCRTTAGDLNGADLDAVMAAEEALHGVAKPTLELSGERPTMVFTTSVANAHRLSEIFNRERNNCARAVDGTTPKEIRQQILDDFRARRFQYLVNVGVLTEGVDVPITSCIAVGRPTKSRALYTQIVGRGLRPVEGKRDCLVIDFTGISGRHDLIGPEDVLGGKFSDEEVSEAKDVTAEQPGIDAQAALEEARKRLIAKREAAEAHRRQEEAARAEAARRAALRAQVLYRAHAVDPFRMLGVRDPGMQIFGSGPTGPATPAQLQQLREGFKLGDQCPRNLSSAQAQQLIRTLHARRSAGLATFRQTQTLARSGIDATKMPFATASRLIDALKQNGWQTLPPTQVAAIVEARP